MAMTREQRQARLAELRAMCVRRRRLAKAPRLPYSGVTSF